MKQGISIEKTLVFGGGDKKIPVVLKGLTSVQSYFKLQFIPQYYKPVCFKTLHYCTTQPLLKLKRSFLLVMYSMYNAFAAILITYTALLL